MATPKQNQFQEWQLTESEILVSKLFSDANIMMLQNLRAAVAQEKLALLYTPNDPLSFAQREAELQGQLCILNLLIEQHVETSNQLSQGN